MTIEIGLLFSAISVIIAILGYQINKTNQQIKKQQLDRQEVRKESQQEARVETQLDYISRGVDDIRIDLKANEKQTVALGERVTRVEESSKQAHKRIDNITNDGGN